MDHLVQVHILSRRMQGFDRLASIWGHERPGDMKSFLLLKRAELFSSADFDPEYKRRFNQKNQILTKIFDCIDSYPGQEDSIANHKEQVLALERISEAIDGLFLQWGDKTSLVMKSFLFEFLTDLLSYVEYGHEDSRDILFRFQTLYRFFDAIDMVIDDNDLQKVRDED